MVGRTISHYKILNKLGEGGMGVVYKAEDAKLERTVALKFLAPHLVQDPEVRKRFEREAKAAASLSHPNVCHVYEIDEAEGKTFIAMAYVEGESLDEKIGRGPLKLDEALDIAQQIAKGLEAAHEKGIFHRDIKPENVIVDSKGHVTIMDFGLAQLSEASRLTKADQTMGTTAYMSPEQTDGSGTDHRTDIWSLGVVLYEMVTGQQPFKGEYGQAVMYSILNEEPEPVTALRAGVPMELEFIVGKCLAKAPDERYSATGELYKDLRALKDKLKSGASMARSATRIAVGAASSDPALPTDGSKRSLRLAWAFSAVALACLAGLSYVHFNQSPQRAPVRKFTLAPEGFGGAEGRAAISPNGRYVVYVAGSLQPSLHLHDLAQGESRELPDTVGGRRPFWAPDSESLGYIQGRELKRFSLRNDSSVALCTLPSEAPIFLATWSPDGAGIAFRTSDLTTIFQVSAAGGDPRPLIEPRHTSRRMLGNPYFPPTLAGRRLLLYSGGSPGVGELFVHDLDSDDSVSLGIEAALPVYSPSGHLLYLDSSNNWAGTLWAAPFDVGAAKITGDPFIVAEDIGWPSVDSRGTLVYRADPGGRSVQLVWKNRVGETIGRIGNTWFDIAHLRLSPPGSPRRLAFAPRRGTAGGRDVFVHDFDRGVATQLTFNETGLNNWRPVWSPDGRSLVYTHTQLAQGGNPMLLKAVGAAGEETVLLADGRRNYASDWSFDGRHLVYYTTDGQSRRDLWRLELDQAGRPGKPQVVVATPAEERDGVLSPDGAWLAYASDRTGASEVYIRQFPEGDVEHKVSANGGNQPHWRPGGNELFYIEGDTLTAVRVQFAETLSFGEPERLFSDSSLVRTEPARQTYDVGWDGESFILAVPYEDPGNPPVICIVQNWYEEFRDREQD